MKIGNPEFSQGFPWKCCESHPIVPHVERQGVLEKKVIVLSWKSKGAQPLQRHPPSSKKTK